MNVDLKGPFALSINGFRYAAFFTDSYSRFVIVMFLKDKSEITNATKLAIAEFDATVGVPVDSNGAPLPRPRVRSIRSDHEGGVVSHAFDAFRADASVHLTLSPPHDHDLNPIAERIIGVIDVLATCGEQGFTEHWHFHSLFVTLVCLLGLPLRACLSPVSLGVFLLVCVACCFWCLSFPPHTFVSL